MAYKLPAKALQTAIRHLCRYGDTDVFPHLPEINFLREQEAEIVEEFAKLDLDTYQPGSLFEGLAPKSRLGFRIVHQLPLHDVVLLLASVIDIGTKIEARRPADTGIEAFSYRYGPDAKGSLFQADHTYKDWLKVQLSYIHGNLKIKQVIFTDISDFYARINHHRLENLLDEAAPGHGAARFIKKYIKEVRAKQSFGIPIGGSATRLLAELALSDTDRALQQEDRVATRFVDDFRVFLRADEDAYDVLASIAEQLQINEGLSLNPSKTYVLNRTEFIARLKEHITDASDEAEGAALQMLTSSLYFDDEPDPDELEELKSMNLLGMLQDEVGKEHFDFGQIKLIFRALKLAKPFDAIDFIKNNFSELTVFAKEVVLLMQALNTDNEGCFDDLTGVVIQSILSPPASSIQLIRTWLMELFVRGVVPITHSGVKKLEPLSTALDRRQLHLTKGRCGDKNFFRKHKTGFDNFPPFERPCVVWGAACLPPDEYSKWLGAIKPMLATPTGALFLKWAQNQRSELIGKLELTVEDHSD
jgi:hypothetical protein